MGFSNGDLQALYDRSNGFYRRQLILTTKDKPAERIDDPDIAEKMKGEAEGIFLWMFEGLRRLISNHFQFTESARTRENREYVKRDSNNMIDFMESEGFIRLKADSSASSKDIYETYQLWCEENALTPLKPRSVSDFLVANEKTYNLEHTNTVTNPAGRRVWGFLGIEILAKPRMNSVLR
jgi:putative DNA primase/helicase